MTPQSIRPPCYARKRVHSFLIVMTERSIVHSLNNRDHLREFTVQMDGAITLSDFQTRSGARQNQRNRVSLQNQLDSHSTRSIQFSTTVFNQSNDAGTREDDVKKDPGFM